MTRPETPETSELSEPSTEEPAEPKDSDSLEGWFDLDEPDDPEAVEEVGLRPDERYAFDLAAVQKLDDLEFGQVTILAGPNGSGKSTVIEALAVAAGFNPEGGSRNLVFDTHATHSMLYDYLTLEWGSRPRWGWFLRAETYYGMASHITEDNDPAAGLAAIFPDLHGRSHGESFLTLAESRFGGKGLYLFDEPESALSIQGQMSLATIMAESIAAGSQFIIATHSPMLMAYPGATIYEFDAETGFERCEFDDLVSTTLWRRFFADPESFYDKLNIKRVDQAE